MSLEDNIEITKYKELLPPGMTIDNLTAANNSIKIFSDSKVLKATEKEIISNIDKNLALNIYQLMLKVRRFEEKVGQLYSMGLIGGFCHLYIGQEGIISGIESLASDDDCFITGLQMSCSYGIKRRATFKYFL